MVSSNQLILLFLATIISLAAPTRKQQGSCLSSENAQTIATKWGELISNYSNEAADEILSSNFTDYSEGVNALINTCPVSVPSRRTLWTLLTNLQQGAAAQPLVLTDPTFASRQLFKTGQGEQPLINFKQLALWHSCDSVTIRWTSTNTAPIADVKPIIGLIVMETIKAPAGSVQPYLIDTVYSEFDSGTWLQNLAAAGICGPATSVVGAPAHVSAAPVAAPSASISASSSTTLAPTVPMNETKANATPTASHFRA